MTVVAVVLALLLLFLLWAVALYNGLVHRTVLVAESWHQVDVELSRRHDLVPNLVATTAGYAAHERAVLDAATRARAQALALARATPYERAEVEDRLARSLAAVTAVAEGYPALRADTVFSSLARELVDTEDRLAAARRLYNGNVRSLNSALRTVPTNLVAWMFPQFRPAAFFEAASGARGTFGPGIASAGQARSMSTGQERAR